MASWRIRFHDKWPHLASLYANSHNLDEDGKHPDPVMGQDNIFDPAEPLGAYRYYMAPNPRSEFSIEEPPYVNRSFYKDEESRSSDYTSGDSFRRGSTCRVLLCVFLAFSFIAAVVAAITLAVILSQKTPPALVPGKIEHYESTASALGEEFTDHLKDPTSNEFKDMEANVCEAIEAMFTSSDSPVKHAFAGCEVIEFSNGSVRVRYRIKLNTGTPEGYKESDRIEERLLEHFMKKIGETGPWNTIKWDKNFFRRFLKVEMTTIPPGTTTSSTTTIGPATETTDATTTISKKTTPVTEEKNVTTETPVKETTAASTGTITETTLITEEQNVTREKTVTETTDSSILTSKETILITEEKTVTEETLDKSTETPTTDVTSDFSSTKSTEAVVESTEAISSTGVVNETFSTTSASVPTDTHVETTAHVTNITQVTSSYSEATTMTVASNDTATFLNETTEIPFWNDTYWEYENMTSTTDVPMDEYQTTKGSAENETVLTETDLPGKRTTPSFTARSTTETAATVTESEIKSTVLEVTTTADHTTETLDTTESRSTRTDVDDLTMTTGTVVAEVTSHKTTDVTTHATDEYVSSPEPTVEQVISVIDNATGATLETKQTDAISTAGLSTEQLPVTYTIMERVSTPYLSTESSIVTEKESTVELVAVDLSTEQPQSIKAVKETETTIELSTVDTTEVQPKTKIITEDKSTIEISTVPSLVTKTETETESTVMLSTVEFSTQPPQLGKTVTDTASTVSLPTDELLRTRTVESEQQILTETTAETDQLSAADASTKLSLSTHITTEITPTELLISSDNITDVKDSVTISKTEFYTESMIKTTENVTESEVAFTENVTGNATQSMHYSTSETTTTEVVTDLHPTEFKAVKTEETDIPLIRTTTDTKFQTVTDLELTTTDVPVTFKMTSPTQEHIIDKDTTVTATKVTTPSAVEANVTADTVAKMISEATDTKPTFESELNVTLSYIDGMMIDDNYTGLYDNFSETTTTEISLDEITTEHVTTVPKTQTTPKKTTVVPTGDQETEHTRQHDLSSTVASVTSMDEVSTVDSLVSDGVITTSDVEKPVLGHKPTTTDRSMEEPIASLSTKKVRDKFEQITTTKPDVSVKRTEWSTTSVIAESQETQQATVEDVTEALKPLTVESLVVNENDLHTKTTSVENENTTVVPTTTEMSAFTTSALREETTGLLSGTSISTHAALEIHKDHSMQIVDEAQVKDMLVANTTKYDSQQTITTEPTESSSVSTFDTTAMVSVIISTKGVSEKSSSVQASTTEISSSTETTTSVQETTGITQTPVYNYSTTFEYEYNETADNASYINDGFYSDSDTTLGTDTVALKDSSSPTITHTKATSSSTSEAFQSTTAATMIEATSQTVAHDRNISESTTEDFQTGVTSADKGIEVTEPVTKEMQTITQSTITSKSHGEFTTDIAMANNMKTKVSSDTATDSTVDIILEGIRTDLNTTVDTSIKVGTTHSDTVIHVTSASKTRATDTTVEEASGTITEMTTKRQDGVPSTDPIKTQSQTTDITTQTYEETTAWIPAPTDTVKENGTIQADTSTSKSTVKIIEATSEIKPADAIIPASKTTDSDTFASFTTAVSSTTDSFTTGTSEFSTGSTTTSATTVRNDTVAAVGRQSTLSYTETSTVISASSSVMDKETITHDSSTAMPETTKVVQNVTATSELQSSSADSENMMFDSETTASYDLYYNETTTSDYYNETTTVDMYNETTTSDYYNHTTTVDNYNETTTSGYYNETTSVDKYNETTTSDYYNETTTIDNYNDTLISDYYNETTTSENYNETTTSDYFDETTSVDYYNETTTSDYYNETTTSDYYNETTTGDYYNETTTGDYLNETTSSDFSSAITRIETTTESFPDNATSSQTSTMTESLNSFTSSAGTSASPTITGVHEDTSSASDNSSTSGETL